MCPKCEEYNKSDAKFYVSYGSPIVEKKNCKVKLVSYIIYNTLVKRTKFCIKNSRKIE